MADEQLPAPKGQQEEYVPQPTTENQQEPLPPVLQVPVNEFNIELTQEDIAHFPNVLKLFAELNAYHKRPNDPPEAIYTYPQGSIIKNGNPNDDMNRDYWREKFSSYSQEKKYISRLIYYYGRHIELHEPEFNSIPGYTYYGMWMYYRLGYRGLINLIQKENLEAIRDRVVKAMDYYYDNHPSRQSINKVLNSSLCDLKGRDFILLMDERDATVEYRKLRASAF